MSSSTFDDTNSIDQTRTIATGHFTRWHAHVWTGNLRSLTWHQRRLCTTASDLANFFIEIQRANDGDNLRLLSSDITHKMLTRVNESNGLGIQVMNHAGELYMGQTSSQCGLFLSGDVSSGAWLRSCCTDQWQPSGIR